MNWRFILLNTTEGSLTLEGTNEPLGWDDAVFSLKRDEKLHGLFFEYSLPLKFICDGEAYIRRVYETQGIDAEIKIWIQEQCGDNQPYATVFEGRLNLTTLRFNESSYNAAEVNIERAGALQELMSKLDTPVDLQSLTSLDGVALTAYGYAPYSVTFNPKTILKRGEHFRDNTDPIFTTPVDQFSIGSGVTNANRDQFYTIIFALPQETINEIDLFSAPSDDSAVVSALPYPDPPDEYYILTESGNYEVDFAFDGVLTLRCDGESSVAWTPNTGEIGLAEYVDYTFKLKIGSNIVTLASGTVMGNTFTYNAPWWEYAIGLNVSHSNTYALNAGDTIIAYFELKYHWYLERDLLSARNNGSENELTFTSSYLNLSLNSALPATQAQCFAIHEALSRVVESVTNNQLNVKSDYFGRTNSQPFTSATNGCGGFEVVTSGFLLRQFSRPFFVTFAEFIAALNAVHNIGVGIETYGNSERIRVENFEYFYSNTIALIINRLDKVEAKYQRDITESEYYATLECGYAKWENEEYSGLDEFNTKRVYSTPIKRIRNKISQICSFVTSGYAIEIARRFSFVDNQTLPYKYDDDKFLVCVESDVNTMNVIEQGVSGTPANIIDPPTVINWRLNPYYVARRWLSRVGNVLFTNLNQILLRFASGEANITAEGEENLYDGSNNCNYGQHAAQDSMNAADGRVRPFLMPETHTFEYPITFTEFNKIKAKKEGLILVSETDYDHKEFWLKSLDFKPNAHSKFVLIPKLKEFLTLLIQKLQNAACVGNTGSAIVTATGGVPPYTYLWDNLEVTQTAIALSGGVHSVIVTDSVGAQKTAAVIIGVDIPVILPNLTPTNRSFYCQDGIITAAPTGGTAPYTYSLNGGTPQGSNTFTGLDAGNYTVTVTDANGCIGEASVDIETNPASLALDFQNALNFDGAAAPLGDYVRINHFTGLPFPLEGTIGVWFKPGTNWTTTRALWSSYENPTDLPHGNGGNNGIRIVRDLTTNKLVLTLTNNSSAAVLASAFTLTSGSVPNDTNWHYIVFTWSFIQNKVWIYIDGVIDAAFPKNTVNAAPTVFPKMVIAQQKQLNFNNGTFDEFQYYERALDACEIAALWNGGTGYGDNDGVVDNTALECHLKLNESSGNTAADASGNANDGTLLNFGVRSNLGGGAWIAH